MVIITLLIKLETKFSLLIKKSLPLVIHDKSTIFFDIFKILEISSRETPQRIVNFRSRGDD